MTESDKILKYYYFDDFTLDLENRELRKSNEAVPLNSKYFDVLTLLIQRRGQLTSKQYIFDQVWDDVVVTDSALSQCIKDIRKQLNDDATKPRYIKTVPKHGFIFVGDVSERMEAKKIDNDLKLENGFEKRPYKFLDYYTEQDEFLFFGRENEIELISSKILSHRSFIIHGRSGVGKSSITRAGLTPTLKRQDNHVFIIRSFKDPLGEIIQSLLSTFVNKEQIQQNITKVELIKNILATHTKPVVFFLDQFEDFFLLLPSEKRNVFYTTIKNLFADENLPLKLVFVLREDLLAEMSRLKSAIPEIFHNEYRLGRLEYEQAVRAITEPARAVGCPISDEIPKRIMEDLLEDNNIDPPQLQIVCDALFDGRDKSRGITIEEYEEMGGAPKILAGYLERVMTRFNSDEYPIAKEILKALISADNARLVLSIQEVIRQVKSCTNQSHDFIEDLIEELGRARVVRFRRQNGEAWIEVCHDFLIDEIDKWITEEEAMTKRARALLDRSIENFNAHQLLIDKESLDLILPEGPLLGLNSEEADLIAISALTTYGPIPDWLAKKSPEIEKQIINKTKDENPEIRIRAIESSTIFKNEIMKKHLKEMALWDKDLMVRKAASIKIIEQYGQDGQYILARRSDDKAGLIRRAISLAFVRDHNKGMVYLLQLPLIISVLVTFGLMWVRVFRERRDIFRQTSGGTFGAMFSGLSVGLLLAIALSMTGHDQTFEGTTIILVLMSLGALAGAFGGFGVSIGIVTMQNVSFRHSHWWSIIGGALGGFAIGGMLYILEVDIFKTLFGHQLRGVTGAMEGFVIGGTLALGRIVGEQFKPNGKWTKILGASIGAMLGAILLTSIEGNLFSGSIEVIAKSFSKSAINLQPLASFFGEVHFGKISRIALGAIEGFLFGGFLTAGMEVFKEREEK